MISYLKALLKYTSQETRVRISNSLLFRIHERINLPSAPIAFRCELTTHCNNRCEMCTRTHLDAHLINAHSMDEKIVGRIIEEMKKFKDSGRKVTFSVMGLGEPLLFKNIFDVFARIKDISRDIPITVVTNGILLNDATAQQLIAGEIDNVTISLNTNNALEYKQQMGTDNYNLVCANITSLLEKRNNLRKTRPSVIIQYLAYDGNMHRFDHDIKTWRTLMRGEDKCYIHPIVNGGGNFIDGNAFGKEKGSYPCPLPLQYVAVNVNGDIHPCDACYYAGGKRMGRLFLGNILECSPFDMMASKPNPRTEIVDLMRRNDYRDLPACKVCNSYKLASNIFFKIPKPMRARLGYFWL